MPNKEVSEGGDEGTNPDPRPIMRRPPITWKGLIYYGEVFGFLLAWLAVYAVASHHSASTPNATGLNRVASIDVSLDAQPSPVDRDLR